MQLAILFVVYELILAIRSWIISASLINHEIRQIEYIEQKLRGSDEEAIRDIPEHQKQHLAIAYLCLTAENEQLVNSDEFSKLIRNPIRQALTSLNSTINSLPIIGLIGTFLGIIIGLWKMTDFGDLTNEFNYVIEPLLNSAKLAFISSLAALFFAGVLKAAMGSLQKRAENAISKAESALLTSYLTQLDSADSSDKLMKTIRSLNRSINGFVKNFDKSYTQFISEFHPLVEEQKEANTHTMSMIDNVAWNLGENSKALLEITQQQKAQSESFNRAAEKLQIATDSVEKTIKIATTNLEAFIKLSSDMKNNISEMHEPLNKIISENEGISAKMKEIVHEYSKVNDYHKAVQAYQASLNDKLDKFERVGEKVHDVRHRFDDFDKNVAETLNTFISQANTFSEKMRNSFDDYDRQLRSLFQELQNKDNTQLFYYNPEIMKNVDDQMKALEKVIERQQHSADTLNEGTSELLNALKTTRVWGFFRRKREKKGKQREKL